MDQDNFRTIQSIGRKALIQELTEASTVTHPDVVQGIGDDAAVVEADDHNFNLYTSETFMEGVDFDLTYTPLHHLGYKILASCVSDIYAMNGTPRFALLNLAVPNKLSADMLKQIYSGLYTAGKDYNVQVIGGDLTASHNTLSVSITTTGTVNRNAITYRKGACPDDALCISGDLGGALAGLRILMREKEFWQSEQQETFQPELDEYEYVVKRQLVPVARKELIDLFSEHNIIPGSMVDISQGLIPDLQSLVEASGVGAYLYEAALPVAPETRRVADEMKEGADKYALYGGEDLELLFTLPEEDVERFAKKGADITVIGKIVEEEGLRMQTAEGPIIQFEKDK